jgi:[acyl-carrier-protein] S-malonyltransferase
MKAIIFPGQGSQYVGMGSSFFDTFAPSKDIFTRVDEILGFKLSDICFRGPEEELKSTAVQQLAILTVSIAAYQAFLAKGVTVDYLSGLSLGEYTCLYAGGVLSLENLIILVRQRAQAMEEAAAQHPSAMLAVIGMDQEELQGLSGSNDFYLANVNSPNQIVISLEKDKVQKVKDLLSPLAQRVVELAVSGGFHCPFMEPARASLAEVMGNMEFKKSSIPIVSNFTAQAHTEPEEIRENLLNQLISPVLWRQCAAYMSSAGVEQFYEIGPSKVLRGLMRKIDPALKVVNFEKAEDLMAYSS